MEQEWVLHCSERKTILQTFVLLADDGSCFIQMKWCFAYCLETIAVNGDDLDLNLKEDAFMLSFYVLLFTKQVPQSWDPGDNENFCALAWHHTSLLLSCFEHWQQYVQLGIEEL